MIFYDFTADKLKDSDYEPCNPDYCGYPGEDDKWPATIEKDLGWQKEQKENQDE